MKLRRPLTATGLGLAVIGAVLLLQTAQVTVAAVRSLGTWDDSTTTVHTVCLAYLSDGGASALVDAEATTDAGLPLRNSKFFELAGSTRTTALNALSAGQTAWINAQQ